MIPIRPKLKIVFGGTATTFTATSEPARTNVSKTLQQVLDGDYTNSITGIQLSASQSNIISPLDGSSTPFSDTGFSGFISSGTNPSSVNTFDFVFTVGGEAPTQLIIVFDEHSGEHATSFTISVNGSTTSYTNDKASIIIPLTSTFAGDTITLSIKGWSKQNASVKITKISSREIYTIDGSQLISFTCSENIMDSNLSVSPGICEQYADIEIYDKGGYLRNKGLSGQLHKDQDVTLIAVDNNVWLLGGQAAGEVILGDYLTEEWQVENNNSIVKLTCRDTSYKLDKINVPRSTVENRTIDTLLNILFSNAPQMSWIYLDSATESRCKQITIPNCWYYASDLETMLENICNVGMLRIYYFNRTFVIGRCI